MSKNTSSRKRGRPRQFDKNIICELLLSYKDSIVMDNGVIISKTDGVWREIAEKFQEKNEKDAQFLRTPTSFYTYVVCNKDDIKNKLYEARGIIIEEENIDEEEDSIDLEKSIAESLQDSTIVEEVANNASDVFKCSIYIPVTEFQKLLDVRYHWGTNNHKKFIREVLKMRQGEWQDFLNNKIWDKTKIKCGYNFKKHYIAVDGLSGTASGACKCGSEISCNFLQEEEDVMIIQCEMTKGNGQCGKRPLRFPRRLEIGEMLQGKSTHVVRAQMANKYISNSYQESRMLRSTDVYRKIKSQVAAQKYLDPNPLQALHLLYLQNMKGEIQRLSMGPFFIHYCTKHQMTVYKTLRQKKEHVCVAIDATGSLFQRIQLPDKTETGPIFLYIAVIDTPEGPPSVAQMISEKHTATVIGSWLSEWISECGLKPPQEIVCDASQALIIASIKSYTIYKTINQYADSFYDGEIPSCYIRIDVAHVIKKYADLLSTVRRPIKRYYLASLDKIIRCTDIDEVRNIIFALLVISRSEYDGKQKNGELSECAVQKKFMSSLLYDLLEEDGEEDKKVDNNYNEIEDNRLLKHESTLCGVPEELERLKPSKKSNAEPSKWFTWGQTINSSVENTINAKKGNDINPHYCQTFANKLLADIKWLPLWSCIFLEQIGYGRNPASSCHVENEFRKIKNEVLKSYKITQRVRPDEFIEIHKNYIDGMSKSILAKISDKEVDNNIKLDKFTKKVKQNKNITVVCTQSVDSPQLIFEECPVCADGNYPEGAHKCVICSISVHALEPCSVPFDDEEGYGQKRICNKCNQKEVINKKLQNKVENTVLLKKNCPKCGEQSKLSACYICKSSFPCETCFLIGCNEDDRGIPQCYICSECRKDENVFELVQSHAYENWKNKVNEHKKETRGKYLQNKYPANSFNLTKRLRNIPIIKAGSDATLQAVSVNKEKVNLQNTCAFDMIFQLLLVTALDCNKFSLIINNYSDVNDFIKLIQNTMCNGITPKTYEQRAKILWPHVTKGNLQLNCRVINCAFTAGSLCRLLLKNISCGFIDTTECHGGCQKITTELTVPLISLEILKRSDYNIKTSETLQIMDSECINNSCSENVTHNISVGNFIFFEVMSITENNEEHHNQDIALGDIPKKLKLSVMTQDYSLKGLISFDPPRALRKPVQKSKEERIGHYKTFCLRNNNWVELNYYSAPRREQYKVNPHILMYSM